MVIKGSPSPKPHQAATKLTDYQNSHQQQQNFQSTLQKDRGSIHSLVNQHFEQENNSTTTNVTPKYVGRQHALMAQSP